MAERCRLLCVFSALTLLCVQGLPHVIQTQQTVTAAAGGEAHFWCCLLQPNDVRQVTWQKLSPSGERDLASSNKYFGQRVNAEFAEKVAFEDASLQNCSIVLRRVEVQDEGCYRCLFYIYPDGAISRRTCLQLQELHEPLLHVSVPDPPAVHQVVRCQATGRPAPTVTLSVSQRDLRLSNHSTLRVPNTNGSITVHASALLWGSPLHGATVRCSVQLPSGPQRNTSVTLPERLQTSEQSERQTASDQTSQTELLWLVLPVLVLLIFIIVVVAVVIHRRQQKIKREPQSNNTPQREAQPLHGQNQTPLRQRSIEQTRQRIPRRPQDRIKLSIPAARSLFSSKETVDS